jgi:hypothetical protein
MVNITLPPETTVAVLGVTVPPIPLETDDVMVKTWRTVRLTDVVWVKPPPMPVTVMGNVPTGDEAPIVRVTVELPEPGEAIGFGLKSAVTMAGRPEADSETTPLKFPERSC